MCGIAGIFDTTGQRPIDQALLARINEQQHHRGPDETGLHAEAGVGLAHKRLSIMVNFYGSVLGGLLCLMILKLLSQIN